MFSDLAESLCLRPGAPPLSVAGLLGLLLSADGSADFRLSVTDGSSALVVASLNTGAQCSLLSGINESITMANDASRARLAVALGIDDSSSVEQIWAGRFPSAP